MNAYEQTAYDNATAQGLTGAEVRAMGYTQIAELAEVELGPNGESPPDFFYVQVRSVVADAIDADAGAALRARQKADLEAALRLFPSLSGMHVYDTDDGLGVQ